MLNQKNGNFKTLTLELKHYNVNTSNWIQQNGTSNSKHQNEMISMGKSKYP